MLCPCCNQPLLDPTGSGIAPNAFLDALPLSRLQRRAADRLLLQFGSFVQKESLQAALWSDRPDGGPLSADAFLRVEMHHMRKKLAWTPLAIETAGRGSGTDGWRLAWKQQPRKESTSAQV